MKTSKIFLISIISITLVLNPMITMAATSEGDTELQQETPKASNTEEKATSTENEKPLEEEKENEGVKTEKKSLKAGQTQTFNDWFPDDKLALEVATAFNMQATDTISDDELATLTTLDCSRGKITDMTGLEYLTGLTNLNCFANSLTELDVSKNTQLVSLNCANNQLTNIDLSQNTQLTTLDCCTNKFTTLDLSALLELVDLKCSYNTLTELNVSRNSKLEKLNCEKMQIAALDLTALEQLTDLDISSNKLTKLDLSQNKQLVNIDCSSNSITQITGSESLPNLLTIDCDYNKLTELDVTGSVLLTTLSCSYNKKIAELDVTPLTHLSFLYCDSNSISNLNLTQSTELSTLVCSSNPLVELDLTQNTKLIYLKCIGNDLKELDLSTLVELTNLECRINEIAELDLTHNKKLTTIVCDSNPLTELDVSQNTELTNLYCQSSNVTKLDLSHNLKLTNLTTNNSHLIELDLSNNTKLKTLSCFKNHIQDFSSVNDATRVDAEKQIIEMPKQIITDNKITVTVSPNLLDKFGEPMNVTPVKGGVYDQTTNTITWENLTEQEGEVSYDFVSANGEITGSVATPYEAPAPVKGEDVTVHYLSDKGDIIATEDVLTGDIGEEYTSSPKTIPGYTLKTTPTNATGEFTAEPQSVTYVYTKDIEVAQPVTVNYVDTTGATIAKSETFNGNVGDTYDSAAKDIDGYTLTTMPANASGTLTKDAQTVMYVYKLNPITAGQVTVNYLDNAGNKIADSVVLTGNMGDSYTLTPKTIDGYTLSASPTTENGLFMPAAQTFDYVYTKNVDIENSTIEVRYVDEANNPISSPTELTGKVDDNYQASPKEIAGYSLKTTPANEKGTFTANKQTVIYVYTKDTNAVTPTPKAPTKPIQIIPKNSQSANEEENPVNLPKTGDSTPWQPVFAGMVISASAWMLWRKRK
ncbi:LPXTG cell wall anchor domain-containing protein [Listeria seeligeri]|uniref:MucBP domain-containing protein n=1 Tax=Listeria seeligeri TaxID=1640 RepID=UPI0016272A9D|nr:MucBP domain-containing protein [Listeria seeligeri]MBC1826769.1 LPXTG cell wall anchor domain-containing protein [Listeria seeligeri]MBC6120657.1 LPXTG cell wall anchor domain-containing protein [Listeria seeligeri]MBC6142885.1 LPXTG cell wall anchor domain-containing protein [Listeria seeligeri]